MFIYFFHITPAAQIRIRSEAHYVLQIMERQPGDTVQPTLGPVPEQDKVPGTDYTVLMG